MSKKIYCALVESSIQCCIDYWGGIYFENVRPIALQQKHFVTCMLKLPRNVHYLPLFMQLKILPLIYLYIFKVLQLFHLRTGQNVSDENL